VYVDDGGDSESSQYMRDILQVEEQSRCNQLKNKAAQNNIGKRWFKHFKRLHPYITTLPISSGIDNKIFFVLTIITPRD